MSDKQVVYINPRSHGKRAENRKALLKRLHEAPVGFKLLSLTLQRRMTYTKIGDDLYSLTSQPLLDPNKRARHLVFAPNAEWFWEYAESVVKDDELQHRTQTYVRTDNCEVKWIADIDQTRGLPHDSVVVFLEFWWNRFPNGDWMRIQDEMIHRFETVIYVDC